MGRSGPGPLFTAKNANSALFWPISAIWPPLFTNLNTRPPLFTNPASAPELQRKHMKTCMEQCLKNGCAKLQFGELDQSVLKQLKTGPSLKLKSQIESGKKSEFFIAFKLHDGQLCLKTVCKPSNIDVSTKFTSL